MTTVYIAAGHAHSCVHSDFRLTLSVICDENADTGHPVSAAELGAGLGKSGKPIPPPH